MATMIERKAKGIYESANFGIYYEGVVTRRKEWVVKPLTTAATHVDVSAKNLSLAEAKEAVRFYEALVALWIIKQDKEA